MIEVSKSRVIDRRAAAVWDALADFGAIAAWAPNVDHSSAASEPSVGQGAVRRVQLGRIALLERVTSWQPGSRLAYALEGLPPPAGNVTTSWQLADQGGTTLATVTTTIEPLPGPPGRIVGKVLARRMSGAAQEMLDGLASYVAEAEK